MSYVTGFVRFWYDFIIGDDWLVAVVVVLTLILLLALSHGPWWLLPAIVILVLGASLWRATQQGS